jgi:hypothetical protein
VNIVLPKLSEAEYRGDYCIWLRFADGVEGEIDLEDELWGEIFEPLKDKTRFSEFVLNEEVETIVWPNGADFAPEFLYQKLRPNYALKPTPKSGAA